MSHTTIPSIKGQITIPVPLRKKYHITQQTPIILEDSGGGVITLKVMQLVDYDAIAYYENKKEFGLAFKNGIDPKVIIDAIKDIDG